MTGTHVFWPGTYLLLRFFNNRGAVAGTFGGAGVAAALILLTIFLCCRRNRRNKERQALARNPPIYQPKIRENPFTDDDDPFASSNPCDSAGTTVLQHSWEKPSYLSATDEQGTLYVENGFNTQRSEVGNNVLYETKNPRLAGVNTGVVINYRNQNTEDPFSDRQAYQLDSQPSSYARGPTTINRLSPIPLAQAHIPFPNWRRASDTPSSPSMYPSTLQATEDDESDRVPTPTPVATHKAAAGPNQSYNWGASANKPNSYRVNQAYVTPPDSSDGHGPPTIRQQRLSSDGHRESIPPPIPPRNPLRHALSMRTLLNVSSSTALIPLSEHSLTA